MNAFSHFETFGEQHAENPYMPFVVALEQGIITDPEEMVDDLQHPAGVYIANGVMPNNRGAGIVAYGDGVAAYDLSTIVFNGKNLEITPSSKSSVDHDTGRIIKEGGIVLELGDGRIRLAGLAIDVTTNSWRARELMKNRFQHVTESIAVVALSCFDAPEYEIKDIQVETGVLKAQERNNIYSF